MIGSNAQKYPPVLSTLKISFIADCLSTICTKTERITALSTLPSGSFKSSQDAFKNSQFTVVGFSFKKPLQVSKQSGNLSEKITFPSPFNFSKISIALKLNNPVPQPISRTVSFG